MSEYRTIDGSNNNLSHPDYGQAGENLLRIAPSAFEDGLNSMAGQSRPGAREISNELFEQIRALDSGHNHSNFLWMWGQFIDHDIDLTPIAKDESAPIAVPKGDRFFDPDGTGNATIDFTRSGFDPDSGVDSARSYPNAITAFVDASQIYGSDAERAEALRAEGGYLKVSAGKLLPFNELGLENDPDTSAKLFVAGDVRANENVGLTSMHTLFVREHNRLVEELKSKNPGWDEEILYQEAKKLVEAQVQAITYKEFLPKLIGHGAIPAYDGYDPDVNPQISTTFSTAAFRVGHTMLSPVVQRIEEDGSESEAGHLLLREAFFRPDRLGREGGIDDIFRGAADTASQSVDSLLIDDVRNFLFGEPGSGGFDLGALNIQRGRDHGLADYNTTREAFGLPRVNSFAEITSDERVQQQLEWLYETVDDIDVFVGGLAEDPVPGAVVGELFQAVIVDQFARLRDGDRFWYENRLSADELAMIDSTTLSDIIKRNTDIEHIQDDVFTHYNRVGGSDYGDPLSGTADFDLVIGGLGEDAIVGYEGNDYLLGDAGADRLEGGVGDDRLDGGVGDDYLIGGEGNDVHAGGDGNDTVYLPGEVYDYDVTCHDDGSLTLTHRDTGAQEVLIEVEIIVFADYPDEKVLVSSLFHGRPEIHYEDLPLVSETLWGSAADDVLFIDGLAEQYELVQVNADVWKITNTQTGQTDTLHHFDAIQFKDQLVDIENYGSGNGCEPAPEECGSTGVSYASEIVDPKPDYNEPEPTSLTGWCDEVA